MKNPDGRIASRLEPAPPGPRQSRGIWKPVAASMSSLSAAGPGGLASAMLLARQGMRVTVFERDAVVGGAERAPFTAPGG